MGKLLDKTLGKIVDFTFNSAVKGTVGGAKIAGKAVMGVGAVSEKIIEGTGDVVLGTAKGVGKVSNVVNKAKNTVENGIEHLTGKKISLGTIKDINDNVMEDQTLYGRLIGKELTGLGVTALTAGAMTVSTVNAIADNGMSKVQKLGYTSVGDNLDRLVSYDGSGFVNRINEVSNGDYEVMQDIVKNTFTDITQTGVSGDIVFALHNMREG